MTTTVVDPPIHPHPVQAAQARIAEAFAATERTIRFEERLGEYLLPILQCLDWQGTTRQLAEAMPHENSIRDVDTLRAVLFRLGIDTPASPIDAYGIRSHHCPCLLIGSDEKISLVVSRTTDGSLQIHDPATKNNVQQHPDLFASHRVRLLQSDASAGGDESPQSKGFIWPVVCSVRRQLIRVFWKSLAINVIGLSISLYVMLVYDKVIGTHSLDTLVLLALGVILALLAELRLRISRADELSRVAARFDATVAIGSLKSVLGLPLQMSEGAPLGLQLGRFRQFEVGRELFGGHLATALIDLPFTIFFFALIFSLGGAIGFIPVGLALTLGLIGVLAKPGMARQTYEMGELKTKSDALLVEMIRRGETIRVDSAEAIWIERAGKTYGSYIAARFKSLQLSSTLQTISQALVSIAGIGVLGFGAMSIMHGTMSVGALIAIMVVVWRVLGPIQTVFLSLHRIKAMATTIHQIEQLMKIKPERGVSRIARATRSFSGAIELSDVSQRYGSHPEHALKFVSLNIKAGEFVTITGASGSGKSTLLKAILGLYPIQAGSVRLDGLDLRQISPPEVRQGIGYVPQEPMLLYGTVAQNLRFCSPDASDADLINVLSAVGISGNEQALPQGIGTHLDATARQSLSPALVQRIALARIFVRHWPIILLDEPATHLDRDGDSALVRTLSRLKGRSTIIMITARPSHMRLADRVVVMENGQIVRKGHPDKIVPTILSQISVPAA